MSITITTRRKRLVILRALGLGDFLTAIPAYRALARAFPEHDRILAAPISLAPLVTLSGAIDEIVDTRALEPLDDVLHHADVVVNLHGRGPQSHHVALAAHPRRFFAFANRDVGRPQPAPQWCEDEHEVDRWCRMLEFFNVPCDRSDLDLHVGRYTGECSGRVLLHPGASDEARRWPIEKWIGLAERLLATGVRVAISGSSGEFRRARLIARNAGLGMDCILAGKTTLADLASVVTSARAVVCGDTGMAHLATAVGAPSVVLFGPMSPTRWGPPKERLRHRVIWKGIVGDPHARTVAPGLAAITVDEVIDELKGLFALAKVS